MDDIEAKALIERLYQRSYRVPAPEGNVLIAHDADSRTAARLLEEALAYKQEVSDIVEAYATGTWDKLNTLIIPKPKPKPDPLVEVLTALDVNNAPENVDDFRAKLDALGFEIREKGQ